MNPSLALRIAVLFAGLGLAIVLLLGQQIWSQWQDYRALSLVQHNLGVIQDMDAVSADMQNRVLYQRALTLFSNLLDGIHQDHRDAEQLINHQLGKRIKWVQWQIVLLSALLVTTLFLLAWLYWQWVMKSIVFGFASLSRQLTDMVARVEEDRFELVRLPKALQSRELSQLVDIINHLLTDLEAHHLDMAHHLHAQEQMVQAVIDVMTQVNQGNWEVQIELPAEGQLALLKQTLNQSIEQVRQMQMLTLHQERLTLIGNMAASMAHEINNPIAGILMNLEYLDTADLTADSREVVAECLHETLRVSKLIKSMLAFSRKENISQQVCDLASVLDNVAIIAQSLMKSSGIHFVHDTKTLARIGCRIKADSEKLEQVLINLINNSVQSMSQQPPRSGQAHRLIIDTYLLEEAQQILIRVSDTGIGIPAEVRDRIFDPFFTTKKQQEGTGLGLSISMQIVKSFGGMLVLDESYQQGARFLLYLPVYELTSDQASEMISDQMRQTLSREFGVTTYQHILDQYRQLLPDSVAGLRAAFAKEDMVALKHLAHDLKGSSYAIGVVGVANACAELEVLVMGWDSNPRPEVIDRLLLRLDRLSISLAENKVETIEIQTPAAMRK